ncbi:Cof-type HAD-IIB family hydrolase [Ligilactobacillus pobuzihii]|uniref:Cof-type HAD-IIB family hydrolase n=1 Tax=Ligilactobacillus pobuzihii TaxID=449659 RepID=UPI00037321D0|nr:Cof-type HAD-IIB family hydrolase [Ligilactobacillus pobuzihii]GEN48528.1 haloacid dehalogenase [Ligilactobacillus pobuzihii]
MIDQYKLVAVDMDGTFLNDQKDYDQQCFRNLYQKMQERGIQFVVASGNQYYQLQTFFSDFPEIIYVADNGAYIRDVKKEYFGSYFKQEQANEILKRLNVYPHLFDELVVSGFKDAYVLNSSSNEFIRSARYYNRHLQKVHSFSNIFEEITKYSFNYSVSDPTDFMKHLQAQLSGLGEITTSGHGNFDIIQPGVHKASGLKKLGQLLNIPLRQMCAFGDGLNDLEMLEAVGDGVAMANAAPEVKKIAQHETGNNNEQGVLQYLDRMLKNI